MTFTKNIVPHVITFLVGFFVSSMIFRIDIEHRLTNLETKVDILLKYNSPPQVRIP